VQLDVNAAQSPLHPVCVVPFVVATDRTTEEPAAKLAVHVPVPMAVKGFPTNVQSMPAGLDVTVPRPYPNWPRTLTVNVCALAGPAMPISPASSKELADHIA
jgi:hypothetical protein